MKRKTILILMILTFSPILLLADGYGRDGWFHHIGNGWNGYMGGGWLMILWIGIVLFILFGLARWAVSLRSKSPG